MILRPPSLKFALAVLSLVSLTLGLIMLMMCSVVLTSLHNWHYIVGGICIWAVVIYFLFLPCGLSGVKCESQSLLGTFGILVAILTVAQISIYIALYMLDITKISNDLVHQLWIEELKKPGPMASLETSYHCCGGNSWRDYPEANLTVPYSCYAYGYLSDQVFSNGCFSSISSASAFIMDKINIIFWLFTVFEAITSILAVILSFNIEERERRVYNRNNYFPSNITIEEIYWNEDKSKSIYTYETEQLKNEKQSPM